MDKRFAGRVVYALLFVALILAAVALVRFADRHAHVIDLTRDARYSLHEKSIAALSLLDAPLEVLAFVPEEPALRAGIADFFARYQRHKPDLELEFVDPRHDVERARLVGGNLGEIVLVYAGRKERVLRLTDSEVTSALARLKRGGDRFVTFLANHGERRAAREGNADLSDFVEHLERRGLKVREVALGATGGIPDNTAVLLIASPSIAYLPSELELIAAYVERGGNLLWLSEPDAPSELGALESTLGVRRHPGTIVDPIGLTKLRNPAYAVALEHGKHPLLDGFNQTLAFPYAAALVPASPSSWSAAILAHTAPEAWTETGPLEGNVGFDQDDEVQGELAIALALTRPAPGGERTQRVVVVGDGDFLSNVFVGNLGNLEFGRRVVEWLARDDVLIDIEVPEVPDAYLDLDIWQRVTIFAFFGVALPLAFAMNAALLWWRRRNA